jgi:hypothetical protein
LILNSLALVNVDTGIKQSTIIRMQLEKSTLFQ